MQLLLLLIVVCLTVPYTSCASGSLDISTAKVLEETSNLEKAKDIFNQIKNSDFVKTMKDTAKWGLPLLKSLNYFSKVLLAGLDGESKELKYMKEQFHIINNKMDVVDLQFEEIKKEMDWNVIKIQFSTYERTISVLQNIIQQLSKAPINVRPMIIDKFINTYEQSYNGACDKLYISFTETSLIFTDNLAVAIRKYTDDYKRKVEDFFIGNIQLILKGLEVETFYLTLKKLSDNEDYWNRQWDEKIKKLIRVMEKNVLDIENNWSKQLEIDTETFSVNNYEKNNEQYLDGYYKYLNDKFDWREWYVIIYNNISGYQNHAVLVYSGLIKFRIRGKNIVVASRPKGTGSFNAGSITRKVNSLPRYNLTCKGDGLAQCVLSRYLLPLLNNSDDYRLAATIKWGAGVWYAGAHRVYRKWEGPGRTLNIIVMG